jgi:PKD repeat protein
VVGDPVTVKTVVDVTEDIGYTVPLIVIEVPVGHKTLNSAPVAQVTVDPEHVTVPLTIGE